METFECINCHKIWTTSEPPGPQDCKWCGSRYIWWTNHPLVQIVSKENKNKLEQALKNNKQL